jgi:hypothetical protein
MTIETQLRNLQLRFDQCQHGLAQLTARVAELEGRHDALCNQMNAFTAQAQPQLVELLQRSGQNIKITEEQNGQSN